MGAFKQSTRRDGKGNHRAKDTAAAKKGISTMYLGTDAVKRDSLSTATNPGAGCRTFGCETRSGPRMASPSQRHARLLPALGVTEVALRREAAARARRLRD